MSGTRERSNPPTSPQALRRRAEEMLGITQTDIADMARDEVQHLVHELQLHQVELELQNEELRRAQLELAESRDLYADLYEFAPVGYVTLNQAGKIVAANLTAAAMLGVERNELLASKLSNFVTPGSQDRFFLHRGESFDGNAKQTVEIEMHKADGTPLNVRAESIVGVVGGDRRCLMALIDITERKRAEEGLRRLNEVLEACVAERTAALRESEGRLRQIFDHSNDAILMLDPERDVVCQANPKACELFGYDSDEILLIPISRFFPRGLAEFQKFVREVYAEGRGWTNEFSSCAKSGRFLETEISASTLLLDGRTYMLALVRDMTERKQAERLLAAEKRVLELIATGAELPEVLDTLMHETEGQSTDGMLCSVLLADEKEQRLLHGAAPSFPQAYNEAIHGIAIGPQAGSCGTAAFERKPVFVSDIAADQRWADFKDLAAAHGLAACHSTPILSSQGRLLGTIAMYYRWPHNPDLHDRQLIERATQLAGIVIERKQAETTLRNREHEFHLLADNVPACFSYIDQELQYRFVNKRYEGLFGRPAAELVGLPVEDVMGEGNFSTIEPHLREALVGRETSFLCAMTLPNGDVCWMNVHYAPDCDEADRVRGVLALLTDVTVQKRTELALQQNQLVLQEQREELQRLTEQLFKAQDDERQRIARDLHDDFGQRLVALTLDVAVLERHPPLLPELVGKALEPVHEELMQLSDDLRRSAHRLHPSLLKHAGLRAALEEYIDQAMRRTDLHITLKAGEVPVSLPLDRATCLFRVCQESLQNVAKHAHATEVLVKLSGWSKGIGLSVLDNGTGFAVHDKSNHRKGLGLNSMQERLRLLNGFLNIHSRPGHGTKVCAWIPCQEGHRDPSSHPHGG